MPRRCSQQMSQKKRQVLGCLGQDLSSEEALAWPLHTILDYMSDMKETNLPSPLTHLKVPCNSHHMETSYLGTKLGRRPSTLPLYSKIQTDDWCVMNKEVMDMVEGCHPLAVYWVEGMKGCHTSHQNLLELYCLNSRTNKRDNLGFYHSLAPDAPNCHFYPTTSKHSSTATTLILSRRRRQKWRMHDRNDYNSKHAANQQLTFSDGEFSSDDDTTDPPPNKKKNQH